jgi:hypothetical protein
MRSNLLIISFALISMCLQAGNLFAQLKPVVIDEVLRNRYNDYLGVKGGYDVSVKDAKAKVEEIPATFPGEEHYQDVKLMLEQRKRELSAIEMRFADVSKGIREVEDAIRKTIREAGKSPVVWRYPMVMFSDQYTVDTYTLEHDSILIKSYNLPFKKGEVH